MILKITLILKKKKEKKIFIYYTLIFKSNYWTFKFLIIQNTYLFIICIFSPLFNDYRCL